MRESRWHFARVADLPVAIQAPSVAQVLGDVTALAPGAVVAAPSPQFP